MSEPSFYDDLEPLTEATMTLGDHLEELRLAVRNAVIWLGVVFIGCLLIQERLVKIVTYPHQQAAGALAHDRLLSHFEDTVPYPPAESADELFNLREEVSDGRRLLRTQRSRVNGALTEKRFEELVAETKALIVEKDELLAELAAFPEGKPLPEAGGEDPEVVAKRVGLLARLENLDVRLTEAVDRIDEAVPPPPVARKKAGAETLQVLSYQEGFINYIKVALICSALIGTPFMGWEIWKFVKAGLYPHERKWVTVFAPLSLAPFVIGVVFGYTLLIPVGLEYLASYASPDVVTVGIRLSDYLSLFIILTLVTGIIFELPLVMSFLSLVDILRPEDYSAYRRWFILGALFVAAFITPPDVITQVMLGVPIMFLYEIGIIAARITVARRRRREAEEDISGEPY